MLYWSLLLLVKKGGGMESYLSEIKERLNGKVKDLSDHEIEYVLGDCVCAKILIGLAKKYRDEGALREIDVINWIPTEAKGRNHAKTN
jgi:hypothetical protein